MSLILAKKYACDILVDARPLKSKKDLEKRVYDIAKKYTSNKRFDGSDNWNSVQWLLRELREGLPQPNQVGFGGGQYREDSRGVPIQKVWSVSISAGGFELGGQLIAGNAGTVDDPFKKYDLALILW